MFAVGAVIAFALALILHLVGHGAAKFVIDFELIGFILISLQMVFGWGIPWTRRNPAP
jgi:hypothetical protein